MPLPARIAYVSLAVTGILGLMNIDQLKCQEHESQRFKFQQVLRLGSADSAAVQNPQRFFRVTAAITDAAGNVFVLDGGHGRVQAFDHTGAYLRTLGFGIGPEPGRFLDPVAMIWLEHGVLGVLDRENNSLTLFSGGGEMIDRVRLPRDLDLVSSAARDSSGQTILAAFSRVDSTTIQFLSPMLLHVASAHKWAQGRLPMLIRRFGGAAVTYDPALGFIAASWNPGALTVFDVRGAARYQLDLSTVVPGADSLVLAMGPRGEWMARGGPVPMINGVAPLEDSTLVVSAALPPRLGGRLLLIRVGRGIVGDWEAADPMKVLGSAGPGLVLIWQDVGGEFVTVYRIVGADH